MDNTTQINPERLAEVQALLISKGAHDSLDQGACVMELVSYVAGEPWSDAPACACPVIAAFSVYWNDALPGDEDRDRLLKPLVPLIVGTRSTKAVQQRRAILAADWLVRVHTPAWLRAAKLSAQARLLEALPEITDFAQRPSLMTTLRAVQQDADAAWAAARAIAKSASRAVAAANARVVAWGNAVDVARNAAGDNARAVARAVAMDRAMDASAAASRANARAVARTASMDASAILTRDDAIVAARAVARAVARTVAAANAGGVAEGALKTAMLSMQDSATDLVRRMCEIKKGGDL